MTSLADVTLIKSVFPRRKILSKCYQFRFGEWTETTAHGIYVNKTRLTTNRSELCNTTNTTRLTHWGRVTHICVNELTTIGSDNGLSPGRRQAIIWNNAGLLLIEPLGTNFSEISIGIQTFPFKKMHLNMSSAKWRPFCLGLNVLSIGNSRPSLVQILDCCI